MEQTTKKEKTPTKRRQREVENIDLTEFYIALFTLYVPSARGLPPNEKIGEKQSVQQFN